MGVIPLSPEDLVLAAALVLLAGVVSLLLRLELEKRLALAAARCVLQLLLIGYVLGWVFALDRAWAVLAVLLIMVAVASRAAVQRASRRYPRVELLAFLTLICTGLFITFTVTGLIVGVRPWYKPQYVIPLLGMVLGNSLTGISLCLDYLLESLAERRDEVEMELAHGATRWEAARRPVAEAVRRGMIPIINSMMVVGLVSLPGMMTGQILAGEDPLHAVQYQIVVMFMLAGAVALGSIGMALLTYRRLFNHRHQLEFAAIRRRG